MNRNDKEFMVQKIRSQYMEKEEAQSDLDTLRELDKEVKLPANVFGYTFGTLSALIMGSGMSLVMTDIGKILGMGDTTIPGIIIGVIGMVMALINYPIYKAILSGRKEKYASKILALSEKIMAKM